MNVIIRTQVFYSSKRDRRLIQDAPSKLGGHITVVTLNKSHRSVANRFSSTPCSIVRSSHKPTLSTIFVTHLIIKQHLLGSHSKVTVNASHLKQLIVYVFFFGGGGEGPVADATDAPQP
jgi:hypothetical protein